MFNRAFWTDPPQPTSFCSSLPLLKEVEGGRVRGGSVPKRSCLEFLGLRLSLWLPPTHHHHQILDTKNRATESRCTPEVPGQTWAVNAGFQAAADFWLSCTSQGTSPNQLACPIPTAVCFKRKDCGKGLPWEDFVPFHPFQVGGVLTTCFGFAAARTDALLWGMWSGALRAIRTPWSYARRIGCLFVCLGMVWSNMVLTNGCRKIPGFVG